MQTSQTSAAALPHVAIDPDKSNRAREVTIAGKTYLTELGLAELLSKSPRTIARWEAMRMGPPRITVGRTVLYDPDKIPDWLARHETKPAEKRRPRRSAA